MCKDGALISTIIGPTATIFSDIIGYTGKYISLMCFENVILLNTRIYFLSYVVS